MTINALNWRTQNEKPGGRWPTALIAFPDAHEQFGHCLYGLASWDGAQWRNENTDEPIALDRYWWVPECELVETLPK